MGNSSSSRIWSPEGNSTFISDKLNSLVIEIDSRTSCKDTFTEIIRVSGLIDKMITYTDISKTVKYLERSFSYTDNKIVEISNVFFNINGTVDSTVVETLSRNIENEIIGCDNPFTTTESDTC